MDRPSTGLPQALDPRRDGLGAWLAPPARGHPTERSDELKERLRRSRPSPGRPAGPCEASLPRQAAVLGLEQAFPDAIPGVDGPELDHGSVFFRFITGDSVDWS